MNSHSLVAMRPSVPGRDCYWLTIFQRDLISLTYHSRCHLIHLWSQVRKDVSKLGFLAKILPLLRVEAITEKYIFFRRHPPSLRKLWPNRVNGLLYKHLM